MIIGVGTPIASIIARSNCVQILSNNPEIEIGINPVFEPEPFILNRFEAEYKEPIFYENEPSKFFGKPKNNFKKK